MPSGDAGPSVGGGLYAADSAVHEDSQPRGATGKQFVTALLSFGKCLGALLPVYLAGYFGFSVSLVLFGLAVYMGWKHHRDAKQTRLYTAMYLMENERGYTTKRVFRSKRELPAWVNFPDVEKVEWLNKILQQAWPFVGQYLEKLLVETVAPSIRASSGHLQTFSFTKVNLGDKPMKVVGVKAYTEHDKRQVLLDLYISYAGDVEINVEVKKYFCKAGVKGIQLHGKMRVILEPLIGDVPLVGAITMFFIRRPKLDINWTGLTNLLDIPGLNTMSDAMVMDTISSFLVLPNRLTVPLVADLHVAQLRSPLPRGIVRIHLLEAENLAAKDNYIKGVITGKSDPYAVLRVGTQVFTSHHVDNNLNPQWREMYEVIVHEVPGQELEVEVFDKDPDQDDFLGRVKLDLGLVKKARILEEWFTLKDAPSGKVHLRLEWLSLLSSAESLSEVLQKNQNLAVSSKTTDPPSAAILTVYLDRAQDLPMKKGNKPPSPLVQLSVQDATKESKAVYGTNNPVWEDAFTFFIQDPRKQDLDIQVKDDDRSLGTLYIPLSRLLSVAELSMDQWFQLDNSGPASRIYMKIILRVLWLDQDGICTSPVSPYPSFSFSGEGEEGVISDVIAGGTSLLPTPARPEHTSPDSSFATEGVLRIHLVQAQDLVAKDTYMGGMMKGKSDPYVKIRVGGLTFKSHVIKENLNPVWNELYEVILTALPGQEVQLDLYDKDLDQDDFLGRFKLNLSDLISAQYTDQWYILNDVKSGKVHLMMEWLPRVSDPHRLEQILRYQYQETYGNKAVPSAAMLFVYVERAYGLPLKKSGKEPKAGAELSLRSISYRTKLADRSTSPRWDEAFCFLVHNPREDILFLKVSHSWGQPLGTVVLPVKDILAEQALMLDRWLNLDGALPESQILIRAELKLLYSKLAQYADVSTEEAEHIIPSADAASAVNQNLRHRTVSVQGDVEAQGSGLGQVKLSIVYSTEENRLVITICACRKLPSRSKDGLDSYVSFILQPDKNRSTKRKTSIRKRDLNPEFNERLRISAEQSPEPNRPPVFIYICLHMNTGCLAEFLVLKEGAAHIVCCMSLFRFDFDFSLDDAMQRRLDLSVKSSGSFISREREVIGKLQLDLNQLDLRAGDQRWYDLTDQTI